MTEMTYRPLGTSGLMVSTIGLGTNAFGGGGGERHERDFWKNAAQGIDLAIFGAEIMAPFADAMGFVDGEQIDVPAF